MKDLFNKTLIVSIVIHILMFTQINTFKKTIEFESLIPILVGLITMLIVFKVINFTKMNFIKKQYVSWFGYISGYCLGFLYFVIVSL